MNLFNWIKKPYFFINSTKLNLIICIGCGLFIFIFLYIFQPFGIHLIENDILLYTLGFGFVTFAVQTFFFILLPYLYKDFFDDENWTVGKNIIFLFSLVSCITFFNWYYNSFAQNTQSVAILSLKDFFVYTFSIAILPVTLFTYVSEKLYRIHRQNVSKILMKSKVNTDNITVDKKIIIYAENKKDTISFNIDTLVYITTQGNYASFYFYISNELKEQILRNSLTRIALQLKDYNTIKRCHKSYIIHKKYMNSISGNARGYYLKSDILSIEIPISRNLKKEEIKKLIN